MELETSIKKKRDFPFFEGERGGPIKITFLSRRVQNHNRKLLSKFDNKKLKTVEAISKNLISRKKKTSFPPFLWGREGPIKMITLQGDEKSQ